MKKHRVVALLISATTVGAMVGSQSAIAATGAARPNPVARVVSELGHVRGLVSSASAAGISTARTGQHATITLRGSAHAASPVSADLAVTPDALPNIDTATITGTNDTSNVFVLRDASARADVSYTVSQVGHKLQADPLGGVLIINNATGTFDGRISAPWAYDATGKALPTRFTISGDTITQHVDTAGAVFPVVADPHYTWGWISGTVYFNKSETLKASLSAAFIAALGAFAPPQFNLYLVASSAWFSLVAGWAVADNKCLDIKIYPPTATPHEYSGGYCT